MKTLKLLAAVAAAALIFTAAVSAETINTINRVEQTALLNNLDYRTAVLEVLKAENAVETRLKLDNSSLSLAGSWEQQTGGIGWQASANLPLFEQLSLSAGVNQDLDSTYGISLAPLAHSSAVQESELNYQLKIAAAEQTARETADAAVTSYLSWAAAAVDYEIRQDVAEVKQVLYEDEKIRFDAGESGLDDVRDAYTEWSEARTALNDSLNNLQSAEAGLYSTLNIDPADIDIEPPSEAELLSLTETLKASLTASDTSITGSYAVLAAESSTGSLELQLKNTWAFEPDLSISGQMTLASADLQPAFSATAAVSIGLDDFNLDEREELATELEISRSRLVQTVSSEELNLEQARISAETAAIDYEIAGLAFEQAGELLDEAEFLLELGEYSEAELEETKLEYEQAQNSLFRAAAEHYTALRALAAYLP